MTRIAVICYSATGSVHALAEAVAEGASEALLALYNTIHHWGGIVVAPGYSDPLIHAAGGNPRGTSHPSAGGPPDADVLAAARYQGRRLTAITRLIAAGAHEDRIAA